MLGGLVAENLVSGSRYARSTYTRVGAWDSNGGRKRERKRTGTCATEMMTEGAGIQAKEKRVKRGDRKSAERAEELATRVDAGERGWKGGRRERDGYPTCCAPMHREGSCFPNAAR